MSKLTVGGLLAWLIAAVLLGFQAISAVVQQSGNWDSMTLVDVLPEKAYMWVDSVSIAFIQRPLDVVFTMPLFLLLFAVGLLLFIINSFVKT